MTYEELEINEIIERLEKLSGIIRSTLGKLKHNNNELWLFVKQDLQDLLEYTEWAAKKLIDDPKEIEARLIAKRISLYFNRFIMGFAADSYDRQLRPLVGRAHAEFIKADPSTPFYRTIKNLLSLAFPCPTCDGFGMLFYADKDDEFCNDCNGTGVKPEIDSWFKEKEEEEEE